MSDLYYCSWQLAAWASVPCCRKNKKVSSLYSSLSCKNEHLAIDGGEYLCTKSSALIAVRSEDGV